MSGRNILLIDFRFIYSPFQETEDRPVQETDRLPEVLAPGGTLQFAAEEVADEVESLSIYLLKMFICEIFLSIIYEL